MLEERYEKTEAGRAEIKTRALVQARVARNLLLVIDASKTGGDWIRMVQGASPADLELLLQQSLVMVSAGAPMSRPMGASTLPPGGMPASGVTGGAGSAGGAGGAASRPMPSRLAGTPASSFNFTQLYGALSAFAKAQGLLKGYKLQLEVEQCQDLAALQALALDVIDRVRATKGDAAAHELRATLGFH